MKSSYHPILSETTRKTFFDYVDLLDIPQIDYFAVGVQDPLTKKSISLMSRPEWQTHFVVNQYAEHDPVRKVTLNTKRNLIPFNEIDFLSSYGKEIMHQRALMEIKSGVILMERFMKFNYIITLGTGFSKFSAFDFIKQYHDRVLLIKRDLLQLIKKDANQFLSSGILLNTDVISHPSGGAK